MHPSRANQKQPRHKAFSFDDTEIAFRGKSNADLERAYWLFKIISIRLLTRIGQPLISIAMKVGIPLKPLIKATIFRHFCGGETIDECEHTINQLDRGKVGAILDYSVEGGDDEKIFDKTCAEIMRTVEHSAGDLRIPLTVFKVSGMGRSSLIEKKDSGGQLTGVEVAEFEKIRYRVDKICSLAHKLDVRVMIDAEESWVQNSIDKLAMEMMRRYNQDKVIVYNTCQLYRTDKLDQLKEDTKAAAGEGFILGMKLVRGAYMEKERRRAASLGYPSPIQPGKEQTDAAYNEALEYCLAHIRHVAFVAGTHNEQSCRLMADLLDRDRIARNHQHVYFAQLLGMSDNLSFNLAAAGYNVAKYVPYGPVKAVLPYLFRRAEENTSVSGQMSRELKLIVKERHRRKRSTQE